jgi:DNA polymerase III delta prime subunit
MNIDEPTESTAFNLLYHTAKDYQRKIATLEAENAALRKRVEAVVSQLRANQHQHKTLAEDNPRRTTHLAFTAAFGEAATLLEKALATDDAAIQKETP